MHRIEIPAGVENGEIIKVPFDEELTKYAVNKANDTFYIKVMVQKSDYFTREGYDVFTKADIDVHTATHGGEIEVKSLHQPLVKLKIPPGTSSHTRLTLPGNGIRREGLYGDQVVEIGIDTQNLGTEEALSVLEEHVLPIPDDVETVITPIVHTRKF